MIFLPLLMEPRSKSKFKMGEMKLTDCIQLISIKALGKVI